jgi:hypothetical protein
MDQFDRQLADALPRRNVRSWGVIEGEKVTIRATCRRCGDNGEFNTRQEVDSFKDTHDGVCPNEKDVQY